jgi:hypothetical protein
MVAKQCTMKTIPRNHLLSIHFWNKNRHEYIEESSNDETLGTFCSADHSLADNCGSALNFTTITVQRTPF